ncbi:NAD(P)/FAD-dependent oxidoreductase [Sphingomonas sp. HF-S3]|uniref:Thioredoxin reductase n=1 Tax=Sphingomonas rustica TaxID=3103142 RepID=A0ABV0B6V4_9SPHN
MQHDVAIIGGSFAGLAAATYLARARQRVCVIDSGRPRNRFADASHGFLGHDGSDPARILQAARDQLAAYPTVSFVAGEAVDAGRDGDGFLVRLGGDSGSPLSARRLILAFGLHDDLPGLPGLRDRWGKSAIHCPYCHGYEFADRPLGVLYRVPMSAHQAMLVADWGPTTLYMNGAPRLDDETLAKLAARGVQVVPDPVRALHGERCALDSIELDDGSRLPLEALYVAPQSRLASPIARGLGCTVEDGPAGEMLVTDADRQTDVPGVYAAGDIARAPHSVSWAVADGVTAGTAVHRASVFG